MPLHLHHGSHDLVCGSHDPIFSAHRRRWAGGRKVRPEGLCLPSRMVTITMHSMERLVRDSGSIPTVSLVC